MEKRREEKCFTYVRQQRRGSKITTDNHEGLLTDKDSCCRPLKIAIVD